MIANSIHSRVLTLVLKKKQKMTMFLLGRWLIMIFVRGMRIIYIPIMRWLCTNSAVGLHQEERMKIESMSIDNTALHVMAGAAEASGAPDSVGGDFAQLLTEAGVVKSDLDVIFEAASVAYGVPANLLKAVAKAESGFRVDATSPKGAMGVMQLMPGTAKGLGVSDAYDPEQNIMGGAKYLSQMLSKFNGNIEYALAGYNAGPGAVEKYNGIPPYNETQNYVRTVMGYLGAGDISAGWATYNKTTGRAAGKEGNQPDLSMLGDSMSKMILMRIIEMQMKSSDEDEKKVF